MPSSIHPVPHIREFPNPVAFFNERFIFTTLDERDLAAHNRIPFGHPSTKKSCLLFSLDEEMRYAAFASDHGPLNLAYTYAACLRIHERLEKAEGRRKPVCLFTSTDPKIKSNMTLIVALYSLIVMKQAPWNAFRPIAHMEVMPFRDAGNGPMDHGLSIQDILYGIDKAIATGLLDLIDFDLNIYQYYETVENGDLNVLGPFIPFASPIEHTWIKAVKKSTKSVTSTSADGTVTTTTSTESVKKTKAFSHSMECVLEVFEKERVGLVVRLNDELYDKRHFVNRGMDHVEMYFDDGTNPTDEIVREFIRLAEETIGRGQKVAVHCKAGLGRTGVLIGAYLIYKYQFSAQEVIGYMRIVRPGMVVGPQQQYMALNQMKWAGWAARDQLLQELAVEVASQEPVNPLATPPAEFNDLLPSVDHPLDEISVSEKDHLTEVIARFQTTSTPSRPRSSTPKASIVSPPKGGDAVGQPRKTPGRPLRGETVRETETPERVLKIDTELAVLSPRGILKETSNIERDTYQGLSEDKPALPPSSQGSMRGIKRGSGRTPLPATIDRTKSAPPRVTLNVPAGTLLRSSSNVSMSSASSADNDPRPPKRRTATSSPLAKNGLSSPPPSRETTPNSPIEDNMNIDSKESTSPQQLRVPNKLRRRGSPNPLSSTPSTPPPHTSMPSSQETESMIPEIASPSPTRALPKRSFLPTRGNIGLRNFMEPKISSREGSAESKSARTVNKEVPITSTPRRMQPSPGTNRVGLTPPRLTGMWGQLSRMSASPASASGC